MALSTELFWIDPKTIQIDRDARQRRQVVTKNLVESIRARGILNPLIIEVRSGAESDGGLYYRLVAGERRLAAALELGLGLVPCRNWAELDPIESQIVELEENIKRQDLPWQDIVRTVERLHGLFEGKAAEAGGGQTIEATADAIGLSKGIVSLYLRVAKALGEERIAQASTVREAYNFLVRRDAREQGSQLQRVLDALDDLEPAEVEEEASPPEATRIESVSIGRGLESTTTAEAPPARPLASPRLAADPAKSILHESFLQWAPRYAGPKFNLIHCDFPYGIEAFSGPQMQASGHEYDDSSDVYFRLIECLCKNLDKFCSVSAHLMFWFSEKHREATHRAFRELAPQWVFQPFPLVWVKSDGAGIASDPSHSPRHVYETCLMATRGRRPIVKIVGDAYSAPTDRRLHVSAKPVPVLKHFMSMLVDESTSLLDPTCGSGNALQAAEALGAKHVLGMEIDETQVGVARQALRQARSLRGVSSLGSGA